MSRRKNRQRWVKWAWGLSLTTMSTGCCLCGRWVPAHDSLTISKAPAGPLDEKACAAACGEGTPCFEATASPLAITEPSMLCVGRGPWERWTVPFTANEPEADASTAGAPAASSAAEGPADDTRREASETPERCASCNIDKRVARDCAKLEAVAAEGERLVVCFRHNDGTCVLDQPAGRGADGIAALDAALPETMGDYFGRLAHAERASVFAFRALATDLKRLGAPKALVRRARRAAREEEHHALAMKRLAKRHGAAAPVVRGAPRGLTSLGELAEQNGVEGCVREAFAAGVVARQARRAEDADVRRAFAKIAPEERAHARLAADVQRFAFRGLAANVRAAVRASMEAALQDLARGGPIAAADVEARVGLT